MDADEKRSESIQFRVSFCLLLNNRIEVHPWLSGAEEQAAKHPLKELRVLRCKQGLQSSGKSDADTSPRATDATDPRYQDMTNPEWEGTGMRDGTAMKATVAAAALALVGFGAAGTADASTVVVSKTFAGNDCAGYFGTGFKACTIFVSDNGQRIELSPVIAKFDFKEEDGSLAKTEVNGDLYPSISGSEFSWTGTGGGSGNWSYTPGQDDPGVRFWVAKGGDFFNLFWVVDALLAGVGEACDSAGDVYNLACLSAAIVQTAGSWATPINAKNGKPYGLSHLTFYNEKPPTHVIPLPAAGWLLLGGLGALGLTGHRRRKHAA